MGAHYHGLHSQPSDLPIELGSILRKEIGILGEISLKKPTLSHIYTVTVDHENV